MKRRYFLKGLLGVSALASMPVLAHHFARVRKESMHVLYGDGIHNDFVAMQALLNGETVLHNGKELRGEKLGGRLIIYLPPGTFIIGQQGLVGEKNVLLIGADARRTTLDFSHNT